MSFWDFFDTETEKANACPICKPFIDAGFEVTHTGGGCMALTKSFGSVEISITDTDSGLDFSDPSTLIFVGSYDWDDENDDGGNYKEFPQTEIEAALNAAREYEIEA